MNLPVDKGSPQRNHLNAGAPKRSIANSAAGAWRQSKARYGIVRGLSDANFRKMRFQPRVFPLHPKLFEIEGQTKEEQLCADIGLASCEKTPEGKVCFEQSEGSLDLNGTAHPQGNPARRTDVALSRGALFPECAVPFDFLGLFSVFRSAAEAALWTILAAFASVPCHVHGLTRYIFGLFSPA